MSCSATSRASGSGEQRPPAGLAGRPPVDHLDAGPDLAGGQVAADVEDRPAAGPVGAVDHEGLGRPAAPVGEQEVAPPVGVPLHLAVAVPGDPGEGPGQGGRVVGRDRAGPPALGPADRQVPSRGLVHGDGTGVLVAGPAVQLHRRREQGRDRRPTLVDLGQIGPEQLGRHPAAAVLGRHREAGQLAGRDRPPAPAHRLAAAQQQPQPGPVLLQHPQLLDPGAGHRAVDADAGGGVAERLGVLDHQRPVLLGPRRPVPPCHQQTSSSSAHDPINPGGHGQRNPLRPANGQETCWQHACCTYFPCQFRT
jgi:hypothetical protein